MSTSTRKRRASDQSDAQGDARLRKRRRVRAEENIRNEDAAQRSASAGGHVFSDITVKGHARVHNGDHNGDLIVQGDYYTTYAVSKQVAVHNGRCLEATCSMTTNSGMDQDGSVIARFTVLAAVVLTIVEKCLLLLLRWLDSVPAQIPDNMAVFEDALGKISRIDVSFVTSWAAFEFTLCSNLGSRPGRRGLQRVISGKYRLQDGVSNELIDPRERPDFAATFPPGRRLLMSMHFEWEEVRDDTCPACNSPAGEKAVLNIRCKACNFEYRTLDSDSFNDMFLSFVELDPTEASSQNEQQRRRTILQHEYFRPSREDLDRPDHFQRITIGAPPPGPVKATSKLRASTGNTTAAATSSGYENISTPDSMPDLLDLVEHPSSTANQSGSIPAGSWSSTGDDMFDVLADFFSPFNSHNLVGNPVSFIPPQTQFGPQYSTPSARQQAPTTLNILDWFEFFGFASESNTI